MENAFTTMQVAELTGATYRQLDHWTRAHNLNPESSNGSGNYRWWSLADLYRAAVMKAISEHFGRTQGTVYQDLMFRATVTDPRLWTDDTFYVESDHAGTTAVRTYVYAHSIRREIDVRLAELAAA